MNFDLDHTSDDGYAAEAIVPQMLAMLQDLVHHKNYANSALLNAIAENEQASADTELRHLLHHILLANRFWVALSARQPFDLDNESRVPESLQAIATLYRETALSHCGMRAGRCLSSRIGLPSVSASTIQPHSLL